jgi:hypothetical protein
LQYTFIEILVYSLTLWIKFLVHYTSAVEKANNIVSVFESWTQGLLEAGVFLPLHTVLRVQR